MMAHRPPYRLLQTTPSWAVEYAVCTTYKIFISTTLNPFGQVMPTLAIFTRCAPDCHDPGGEDVKCYLRFRIVVVIILLVCNFDTWALGQRGEERVKGGDSIL